MGFSRQADVMLAGDIPAVLRRTPHARRITLRVAASSGAVTLTVPDTVPVAEALRFAHSRADWLRRAHAQAAAQARRVQAGAVLPVEGQGLTITPADTRGPRRDGAALLIPSGQPAGPVVAAFLRQLARTRLHACIDCHAAALGRTVTTVTLRDTRSRWGSCTSAGRLMFSWRLAMAPPAVLDYVAAHEVAHLAHMDHSARFWAVCARLCPGYAPARAWLRTHGAALQAWQFTP